MVYLESKPGWSWISFGLLIFIFVGNLIVQGKTEQRLSKVRFDRAATVVYHVTVKTASDEWGTGTDADVFIQIFGEEGNTDVVKLTKTGNLFETGNADDFVFVERAVGSLTKIGIKRNTKGMFDKWKLAQVTVQPANLLVYKFAFNEWIEPNKWVFSYGG